MLLRALALLAAELRAAVAHGLDGLAHDGLAALGLARVRVGDAIRYRLSSALAAEYRLASSYFQGVVYAIEPDFGGDAHGGVRLAVKIEPWPETRRRAIRDALEERDDDDASRSRGERHAREHRPPPPFDELGRVALGLDDAAEVRLVGGPRFEGGRRRGEEGDATRTSEAAAAAEDAGQSGAFEGSGGECSFGGGASSRSRTRS